MWAPPDPSPRSGIRSPSIGLLTAATTLTFFLALTTGLAGCGGAAPSPSPSAPVRTAPATGLTWIMSDTAIAAMGGRSRLASLLAGDTVFDVGAKVGASKGPTIPTLVAASVPSAEAALRREPPPAALIFDLEHWAFSPLAEQADPLKAEDQVVAAAARDPSTILILAPALDLSQVLGGPDNISAASAYLKLNLAADAATALAHGVGEGYVEVQAQSLELNSSAYGDFVRAAVRQIVSADPSAKVLAGLSTSPPSGTPTLSELIADVRSTESLVQGYWLNVPRPGPHCPRCGAFDPGLGRSLLEALLKPA